MHLALSLSEKTTIWNLHTFADPTFFSLNNFLFFNTSYIVNATSFQQNPKMWPIFWLYDKYIYIY